ncbi:hypothetical protein K488DRAFT_71352 [Vararia minispora EC-137]|uniref:Uncharacterized protein n=1 Tax=Vararia minispora EC-137 TaxID=1314806 RepID=A0ACB8QI56_9AGAM|nr:hypothetical protein K488DRAFT_71352 [Vararia minispora EC-137]
MSTPSSPVIHAPTPVKPSSDPSSTYNFLSAPSTLDWVDSLSEQSNNTGTIGGMQDNTMQQGQSALSLPVQPMSQHFPQLPSTEFGGVVRHAQTASSQQYRPYYRPSQVNVFQTSGGNSMFPALNPPGYNPYHVFRCRPPGYRIPPRLSLDPTFGQLDTRTFNPSRFSSWSSNGVPAYENSGMIMNRASLATPNNSPSSIFDQAQNVPDHPLPASSPDGISVKSETDSFQPLTSGSDRVKTGDEQQPQVLRPVSTSSKSPVGLGPHKAIFGWPPPKEHFSEPAQTRDSAGGSEPTLGVTTTDANDVQAPSSPSRPSTATQSWVFPPLPILCAPKATGGVELTLSDATIQAGKASQARRNRRHVATHRARPLPMTYTPRFHPMHAPQIVDIECARDSDVAGAVVTYAAAASLKPHKYKPRRRTKDARILCPATGCMTTFSDIQGTERHVEQRAAYGSDEHSEYLISDECAQLWRSVKKRAFCVPCQWCTRIISREDSWECHVERCARNPKNKEKDKRKNLKRKRAVYVKEEPSDED